MKPNRVVSWARLSAIIAITTGFALTSIFAVAQAPVSGDTYVQSGKNADVALGAGGTGRNLLVEGSTDSRAFIQFDLSRLPSTAISSNISKATLRLFVDKVGAAGTFDVYLVTSPWDESTATYNTQPSLGPVAVSGVEIPLSMNSGGYVEVDVTSLVQLWLAGPAGGGVANYGVAFVPSSGSGISAQFDSKESTSTSHDAEIEIDYVDSTVTNAMTNLQSQLSNVTSEAQSGDASLQTDINAEVSRAETAEATLSASVTSETLRAESAEAAISSGSTTALAQKANLAGGNSFTGDQAIAGNLSASGTVSGANTGGTAISGVDTGSGGSGPFTAGASAVYGSYDNADSSFGTGVYGVSKANGGSGVQGRTTANGEGVYGTALGSGYGVVGESYGVGGIGVAGRTNQAGSIAGLFDNQAGGVILSLRNNNVEKVSVDGSGAVRAASFIGDGSGLTNVGSAADAAYATNAGHANVADSATTAATAATATSAASAASANDSASLGGVLASNYARLDVGDSFAGANTFANTQTISVPDSSIALNASTSNAAAIVASTNSHYDAAIKAINGGDAYAIEGITNDISNGGIGVFGYGSSNVSGFAVAGQMDATSGNTEAFNGVVRSPQGIAAVLTNLGSGKILSGRSGSNATEVFGIDGAGTVTAHAFVGDGSGLTNLGTASNAAYATNAGHASVADSATSAASATTALNASSLGGVSATGFAQLAQSNSFSAGQTVSGNLTVAGSGNGIVFPDGTKQTSAASGAGPTLFHAPPSSSNSISLGSSAAGTYTTVATLNLPAGSYWVFGSVILFNTYSAGEVEGACRLSGGGIDSNIALVTTDLEADNAQVGSWSSTLPIQTVLTLAAPATITMQCGGSGTGYTANTFLASRPTLTALQVGAINLQ